MIKVECTECGNGLLKSPSKVNRRNYCSMDCYKSTMVKELEERGRKFLYKKGHRRNPTSHYKKLAFLLKNDGHPKWRGEKVSYRGLHQWVRRYKGKPSRCSKCGLISHKPRIIQWANVDGLYHRRLEDFVALCVSCHKIHDLFQKKSTRGVRAASL